MGYSLLAENRAHKRFVVYVAIPNIEEISILFTEATEYSRANLHPFHQLIHFLVCHLLP
jgi:hypothetical protein